MSGVGPLGQGQSWRIFIPGEGLGACRGSWGRAPALPKCGPLLFPLLGDPQLLRKGLVICALGEE